MSMDALRHKVDRAARRVAGMISRAIVEAVDDDSQIQSLQVSGLDDELLDEIERPQPYGFSAHPHPGAEGVLLAVGGTRSHGLMIMVDDRRYRLRSMQPGEVAIYDDQGQAVHLKRDGMLVTSPFKIDVEAPEVTVTADTATIEADTVNLGGTGGPAVARVGDTVSGGVITSGSAKVKAV